jgi:hypothetical protein
LAEQSSERAERRVWTPEVVDEQTVTIRTLGPGQDAAATELGGELLQIAEKALNDRSAAERIVTTILQTQGDLVTTAVRALTPDQRQAARDGLARAVRRAALDALPPVVPPPTTDSVPRRAAPATGATRKLRPVQGRTTIAGSTAGEDPAGEPPAAVPAKAAAGGSRKRAVSIVIGLGLMLAGGFALWDSLLRPTADEAAPALERADAAPLAPVASPAEAEPLQLEADEPTNGLLRQPGQATPPTETAAGAEAGADAAMAEGQSSTATASPPFRPIDMTAEAVREPAARPAGLVLPAGGGNLRIFILYPAGGPAVSEASALYADLSRTGDLPLVVLREVGFAIASPRIRYFHAADAEAAGALAAFLDPPRGAWQVQNFGHLSPLPAPGTVEIYVPPA